MKKSTNTFHTLPPASKIKLNTSGNKTQKASIPCPKDKMKVSRNSKNLRPTFENKKKKWKLSTLRTSINGSSHIKSPTLPKSVSSSFFPLTIREKAKKECQNIKLTLESFNSSPRLIT